MQECSTANARALHLGAAVIYNAHLVVSVGTVALSSVCRPVSAAVSAVWSDCSTCRGDHMLHRVMLMLQRKLTFGLCVRHVLWCPCLQRESLCRCMSHWRDSQEQHHRECSTERARHRFLLFLLYLPCTMSRAVIRPVSTWSQLPCNDLHSISKTCCPAVLCSRAELVVKFAFLGGAFF